MVYLYAALGVVMMTGIMAVVEMGLSLTGQSFLMQPEDSYQQNMGSSSVGMRDRQMLNMLHNQDDLDAIGRSLRGVELCDQLLCRSSPSGAASCRPVTDSVPANVLAADAETRLSKLAQLTNSGVSPPDVNGFLSNACALQVGMHRLLIQPGPVSGDSETPYRLFSCVLTQAPTCGVESNP